MARQVPYSDTTVSVNKTIAEIEELLQVHEVDAIMKNLEASRVTSLSFKKDNIPFQLPVKTEAVYQYLVNKRRNQWALTQDDKARIHAQADRCAWRNLMAMVKAQLALVELEMVTITEVFMPYILVANGETAYEAMMAGGMPALMTPGVDTERIKG